MARVLLTGATGTLGTALRPRLAAAGHDVLAASRSPPAEEGWVELDLADGTGVEAALADVDAVVHAASAPQGDTEAVDVRGTERLVAAAADAGVEHVLYPSIVGIDAIPWSYYEAKLAAEQAVADAAVPHTILRATQFHEFVDDLLGAVARLPAWPLPTKFEVQPIAVDEVAAAIAERVDADPAGRAPPLAGPEVHTVGELATAYREARGLRRPIVRLPLPGSVAGAFRAGEATRPDRAVGETTWQEWLTGQYGDEDVQTRAAATPS